MRNKLILSISLLMFLAMPVFSFAANDRTDEYTFRPRKIYLDPQKSVLDKGKVRFLLAQTAGYDNNADLDSNKERDSFAQTFFKAAFTSPLSEKTDLNLDYEMMTLLYAGATKSSLTRNGVRAGVDHKVVENVLFSATGSFDIVEYLNTGDDDYLNNSVELKVTQKFSSKVFHSFAYDVAYRSYEERYTRTTDGTVSDKKRRDLRHMTEYEIGKYFQKDMFKMVFGYGYNNSNDPYLKYYDYDIYKVGGSLTHLFNNKFSGYLSYSKQYRDYRSRTLSVSSTVTEFEKSDLATAAVFYTMNKSLSFGLNYTYRQNYSNEPINKYSGSIVSLSTYYKF